MEKQILNLLDFELYSPTSPAYIKLYNQILECKTNVVILANFLADLSLLSANTSVYQTSLLASAYLFLAIVTLEEEFPSKNKIQHC